MNDFFRRMYKTYGRGFWIWQAFLLVVCLLCILGLNEVGSVSKAFDQIEAANEKHKWAGAKPYFQAGMYVALNFNLVLAALLFVSSIFWWERTSVVRREVVNPSTPSRWFLLGLCGIMVVSGVLRWNLTHRSLWHDEIWNVKVISGYYNEKDGKPRFKEASWVDSLAYCRKATNHVFFSALSRLSVDNWRKLTNKPREAFDEFVIRFPSYVAGILTVGMLGLLLLRWGLPRCGILAALLLAIHPWHIQFATEARMYSLTMFSLVFCMWAVTGVLQFGRWRDYFLMAAGQFLLMASSLINVWLALGLFGLVLVCLLKGKSWGSVIRLVLAMFLALMAYVQLMAPYLLQVSDWEFLDDGRHGGMELWDLQDSVSRLFTGLPYGMRPHKEEHLAPFFEGRLGESFPLMLVTLSLAIGLSLWGLILLWKRHRIGFCGVVAVVLSLLAYVAVTWVAKHYFYSRFMVASMIPYVILLGVAAGAFLEGKGINKGKNWVLPFVVLGAFVWLSSPQTRMLQERPQQPIKDAVQYYKGLRKEVPDAKIVTYGLTGRMLQQVYDPSVNHIHSAKQIQALCDQVDATGETLFIGYNNWAINEVNHPDGWPLLEDRKKFEIIQTFPAIIPMHSFFVLKYLGVEDSQ